MKIRMQMAFFCAEIFVGNTPPYVRIPAWAEIRDS